MTRRAPLFLFTNLNDYLWVYGSDTFLKYIRHVRNTCLHARPKAASRKSGEASLYSCLFVAREKGVNMPGIDVRRYVYVLHRLPPPLAYKTNSVAK